MHSVTVIVGSLRRESINRRYAQALEKLAAGKLAFTYARLDDVPMYNNDLWEDPPAAVTRLKQEIEAADGVLFVTPEHNRSMPPVVKNAVDWASRPWGKNAWADKPVAICGASPGGVGTAVAQAHLRMCLTAIGVLLMTGPEVYFQMKDGAITDDGAFADEGTAKFMAGFLDKFDGWIGRFKG